MLIALSNHKVMKMRKSCGLFKFYIDNKRIRSKWAGRRFGCKFADGFQGFDARPRNSLMIVGAITRTVPASCYQYSNSGVVARYQGLIPGIHKSWMK